MSSHDALLGGSKPSVGISARVIVALVAVALVFGVSGAMIGRYAVPSCAPTPLGSTAGRSDDAGDAPSSAVDVPLSVDTDVFGATSVGRAAAAPAAATAARKKNAPQKKAAPKRRTTRRRQTATRRRTTTRKPRATGTPKPQGGCRDANVIVPALPPSGDRNFAFIKDVRASLKRRTNSPSASNILPPNPDPRGAGMFYKWGSVSWDEGFEPSVATLVKYGYPPHRNPHNGLLYSEPKGYEGLTGVPFNDTPIPESWKTQAWHINDPRRISWRYGMLALQGAADGSEVSMVRQEDVQQYGRWSVRHMFREAGKHKGSAAMPEFYTIVDLVPVGTTTTETGCITGSITIMRVESKSDSAVMSIETEGKSWSSSIAVHPKFAYHSFAIEATPTHITWFVDDRAVMTELRDAALVHPKLVMRIRHGGLRPTDFPNAEGANVFGQFDWLRAYNLNRPNTLPICNVPSSTVGASDPSCA